MSIRLTQNIRERILKDLLAHGFDSTFKQLKERGHVIADKVYNATYSAYEQAFMQEIGSTGFYTNDDMYVYGLNGKYVAAVELESPRFFMPARERVKFSPDSEVFQEAEKYAADYNAASNLRTAACKEAEGILNSVTTVKRLIEVWPEVAAFVPKATEATTNLPALQLDKLNNLLGLPPE